MKRFPLSTALSMLLFAILLADAGMLSPTIKALAPSQFAELMDFSPEHTPMSPLSRRTSEPEPAHYSSAAVPAAVRAVPMAQAKLPLAAASALLEDGNRGLDRFYEALRRTENREKGAITRIVHYGDSPTTADLITGDVRAFLQERFGDAGHGFILVSKPWAWYQHSGVSLAGSGWQPVPASHFEARDGIFGLGGVSFTGSGSAHTRIVFESGAQARFEVWFERQPEGGVLTVSADGKTLGSVETAGESKTPGFAAFEIPSGAAKFELAVEKGRVRVFGVTAEKAGPGVVYDSLGLNGASITVLSRMYNESHWAEELRHRDPDLVVINYGTNEADFAAFVDKQYEKELREAIRRVRAALPTASILVMSPMDRGHRIGLSEIETMPTIPRIVAIQKRVAWDTGCGFFDTFQAMGGEGTMARWYTGQPRLVSADFIHPYPAGGKRIAAIFAKEIGAALNRYKMRQVVRTRTASAVR